MGAISGGTALALGAGAAGLGGLSGLSGRDKQKNLTTTQDSAPWSAQVPYLKEIFSEAQGQYNNPRQYYNFQTYANPSDATNLGLERQYQRALGGSPIKQVADEQNLATIRGDYLSPDSNPYLQSTIDEANSGLIRGFKNSTIPGLQSQFSRAGRYGSGIQQIAQQEASNDLQRQMSKNANSIAFGNYNNERNRQAQAVASAPAYAMSDYNDIGQLYDVGGRQEGIDQQGIDERMNRFDFSQDEPYNALNRYRGLISGNYGGTTTTTGRNPAYKSHSSALLGGGLGGLGALSSLMGSMGQYQRGMG